MSDEAPEIVESPTPSALRVFYDDPVWRADYFRELSKDWKIQYENTEARLQQVAEVARRLFAALELATDSLDDDMRNINLAQEAIDAYNAVLPDATALLGPDSLTLPG